MRRVFSAALVTVFFVTAPARAESDPETVTEPDVHPTLLWLATQLLPSMELAYGEATPRVGARWQITPVLYSWGIHRKLSPMRYFVVEPLVRQSGSIELYFTPEYVARGSSFGDGLVWRTGVRAYVPVVERGDYLSVSVGASEFVFDGRTGAALETGAYVLFGTLGAQLTWSPSSAPLRWIATLRVRYF